MHTHIYDIYTHTQKTNVSQQNAPHLKHNGLEGK